MATIDAFTALNSASTGNTATTANAAGSADRFLKLLVTQMQNQDPLNPLDNAQVTSQMAQINTVSGVEKLNETVAGLNRQFLQMQALQGASLVGRAVTLQGNLMHVQGEERAAAGGFELAAPADRVRVEVLNGAGRVIDTLDLGAQTAGRQGFEWQAPAGTTEGSEFSFRVIATSGAAAVQATALMRDEVQAVSLSGDTLRLDTRWSGAIDYSAVRAIN
ncbi:MAG: flagellar hook assembly protein FlgD [Burkholderiales bacterium]|nr:flagellar hook assembly protein FlgD [Burkholderiales bacterium]